MIVSFHPNLGVLRRMFAALEGQVEVILLVDNGSDAETVRALEKLVAQSTAELIKFPENRGIASAHNAGLNRAIERGLDFALLFDQDTLPSAGLVSTLLRAHEALSLEHRHVAAVGPQWVDERSGRRGQFYRVRGGRIIGIDVLDDIPVEVDFLISSGTLISIPAVRAVGAMREDLFIDHVDTEWCVRAGQAGWRLFGAGAARITHSLGDEKRRVWLGRWREVALHSPDRNYYEVRNTLLLLATPGIGLSWYIAQLTRLIQLLVFYGAFVGPRPRRIARMARGLLDGFRGRGGKLP